MSLTLSGNGTLSGVDIAASDLGRVLQVVRAADSTPRTTTSTSYVDLNISVTITPKKSDSAIILIWSGYPYTNTSAQYGSIRITDASNNAISGAENWQAGSNAGSLDAPRTCIGYDTPATTSAVTYKARFKTTSGTLTVANDTNTGQLYAIEVSA